MRKGKDKWFQCGKKHISGQESTCKSWTPAILFWPWLALPFHSFPQASSSSTGPTKKIPVCIPFLWINLSCESELKSSWGRGEVHLHSVFPHGLSLFPPQIYWASECNMLSARWWVVGAQLWMRPNGFPLCWSSVFCFFVSLMTKDRTMNK